MVSKEVQEFLRQNASKGGKKTAEKGAQYYSAIGKMGAKAKKKKKLATLSTATSLQDKQGGATLST